MLSTKPRRNAAASPQRLRGLLERRADPLHHPEQHQVSDRREGEELRERDAGDRRSSVRDVEPVGEQLAGRAGTPEKQDHGEADHERRRDDRQDAHDAQQSLVAELGTRRNQREREAEERRAGAHQDGEEHRVPGDAAAHA
jgi:hypothetical protein